MKMGLFLESKRIRQNKTLREFCLEHNVDCVLISKIERNRIEITEDILTLCSKIYNTSKDVLSKMDLTKHPDLTNEELVQKLPIFINKNLTEEELNNLAETIRKA